MVDFPLIFEYLDVVFFVDIPFLLFRIIFGVHKAEPVLIILSRIIGLIIEARIAGFFAELDVAQM
jgi:hypothetical protein